MNLKKLIVIVGPTCVGKTDFSIELSRKIKSEIISADSLQVYDKFNICTSKPSSEQLSEVKHHLIGSVPIFEEYSVYSFVNDAKKIIENIYTKGKIPIIVGGTGLYIDALLNNFQFEESEVKNVDINIKDSEMYEHLKKIDPLSAQYIDKNDYRRIRHSIAFFEQHGFSILSQKQNTLLSEQKFDVIKIGLNFKNRYLLYDRINKRVDNMVDKGLLDEIDNIRKIKISKTASAAIGYKELLPYFKGEISLIEAINKIKQQTRRYAKRQITWFKRCEKTRWIFLDENQNLKKIANTIFNTFIKSWI